jgi:TolA-binding protein
LKNIFFTLICLLLSTNVYAENQIYAVQVLMAKQYENADYEYKQLKDYRDTRIEKTTNEAYVVRIGAYHAKTNALALLKKLKYIYTDAFIVKYTIETNQIVKGDHLTKQNKAKEALPVPSPNIIVKHSETPTHPPSGIPVPIAKKSHESPKLSDVPVQSSEVSKNLSEIQKPSTGIEEDLFKEGMQSYHAEKYEGTVSSLSKYTSLTPKSQQRGAALLIIGKSLEQMKRPKSALDIYSRIIEQYPDSLESFLSIVAMADISVTNPGLHYPAVKKGFEYVRDPVSAYDTVLLKNVPSPIIEHIQYQKGLALWKFKHYDQAQETLLNFLKKFPKTTHRREVIAMLKDSTAVLINQYNRLGDHIAVANLFFQGWKSGSITTEDVDILLKATSSLSNVGLHDDSLNILNTFKKSALGKTSTDIDKAVAEIEKKRAISLMDQLQTDTKWNKYQSGREYLIANNLTQAEQTFSDLKNSDSDQFWSKLTEYVLEENKWTQKYRVPVEK